MEVVEVGLVILVSCSSNGEVTGCVIGNLKLYLYLFRH